ncbi:alpha-amylase family glycosyl hydrolase [Thermodesulfobacteriota bacterium]
MRRHSFVSLIALLVAVSATCLSCNGSGRQRSLLPDDDPNWYRSAVFYELFPRSFRDSDGDGIGDLAGIREKLSYLDDLGISAVWLNPIYPTPFFDSGYDVAGYREINPEYGTMEDFDNLLESAHRAGIRVILDLVFNHTSDEHPWFVESRSSLDNPKRDWYQWADPPFDYECFNPMNFQFGLERWTLDPVTGQHYFHHFRPQMPDLNFYNPEMREALLDVVRFWLYKGVDGFRLDVGHMYFEGTEGCEHLPETHDFHRELRTLVDLFPSRAMVGEISGPPPDVLSYLGNGTNELHMVFNFPLVTMIYPSIWTGDRWCLEIGLDRSHFSKPPGGQMANILGNHDFFRPDGLLFGDSGRIKLAATLLMTLPGTPFVYYGEEVGMANGTATVVDYRDAARTPMQWDGSPGGGFTEGTPWIPLSPNWETHNVAVEEGDPASILSHYRKLIQLRKQSEALQSDHASFIDPGSRSVLALVRGEGESAIVVLTNLKKSMVEGIFDLSEVPWPEGEICNLLGEDGSSVILNDETRGHYPYSLKPHGTMVLAPCP